MFEEPQECLGSSHKGMMGAPPGGIVGVRIVEQRLTFSGIGIALLIGFSDNVDYGHRAYRA